MTEPTKLFKIFSTQPTGSDGQILVFSSSLNAFVPVTSASIAVQYTSSNVLIDVRTINFSGSGVSVSATGNTATVTIPGSSNSSTGADISASYIVVNSTSSLPNERALTAGPGIIINDYGANGTIAISTSINPTSASSYFGYSTGSLTWTATTWTDFSTVPGNFTDSVTNNITRSGSTFTVSETGNYAWYSDFNADGNIGRYIGFRVSGANGTLLQRTNNFSVADAQSPMALQGIFFLTSGSFVKLEYAVKNGTDATWSPSDPIDGENMRSGQISMFILGNPSGSSTVNSTGSGSIWIDGGSKAYTTSSIAISTNPVYADTVGTDGFFYVSGTIDGVSGSSKKAIFGGDVRISGNLVVGTGSVTVTSNNVQFTNYNTRVERVGSDLKFYDANNTTGWSLTQLAQSGSAGSGSSINASNVFFVDAPSTSGSTFNDYFTGSNVDMTRWTTFNPENRMTASVENNFLVLTLPNSGADGICGLYQNIPAPSGSNEYAIYTKVMWRPTLAVAPACGLFLAQDITTNPATSQLYTQRFTLSSGTPSITATTWTNRFAASANVGNAITSNLITYCYLRIRVSGSTYSSDYSFDGVSWYQNHTATNPIAGAAKMGVFINNNQSGDTLKVLYKMFYVDLRTSSSFRMTSSLGGYVLSNNV